MWVNFPLDHSRETGSRPVVSLTSPHHSYCKVLSESVAKKLKSKLLKKLLIQRFYTEMSLQFSLEEHDRPLASLSYQSSDEEMEVDSVSVVDGPDGQDSDDEIQVLACYRENIPFPPQLIAGRAMTTELTHCSNDLNIPDDDLIGSASTFTDSSQDLLDWCVGGPRRTSYGSNANDHPITYCGQLNPIRDSPWSPPLEDQGTSIDTRQPMQPHGSADSWYGNSHITGLGISVSGSCGQPNETIQTGCVICGKSSADIKEEITLGYLEQTHIPGETYEQRIARRDAFQAGMKAGTFILVLGECRKLIIR